MDTLKNQLINHELLKIKSIVNEDINGNMFIIRKSKKNNAFIKKFNLTNEDVKSIIRMLSVEDYLSRTGE